MPRRLWLASGAWIVLAIATGPFLIEALDRAGVGLHLPPLSVTLSEIVFIIGLAAAGPLVGALILRRRTGRPSPAA